MGIATIQQLERERERERERKEYINTYVVLWYDTTTLSFQLYAVRHSPLLSQRNIKSIDFLMQNYP